MSEQPPVCPKCGRSKKQTLHGSITQWISECNCDYVLSESAGAKVNEDTICQECGLRVSTGRPGSFTQWIFRSNLCMCQAPESRAITSSSRAPAVASVSGSSASSVEDGEISLPSGSFPTDRYKPIKEIGHGAAGNVYLCRDQLLKMQVAIKCLRTISAEQLVSFQQEARATSKLSHKNIVKILNFGISEGGAPYMVMEHFAGVGLSDLIRSRGALPVPMAVNVFEKICRALSYSHSKGIFHRDIKTSNILISSDHETSEPEVCIIDFGVAMVKRTHETPAEFSLQGQGVTVAGTPAYMSPDQAFGKSYDERSEIYSLGCTLFEALTGSPPFRGETALEMISKHAKEEPPRLNDTGGDFPESLQLIVSRCLAKEQSDRFQTADELGDALAAVLEADESLNSVNLQERAPDALATTLSTTLSTTSLLEDGTRLSTRPVLLLLIALTAGAGVAIFWLAPRTMQSTSTAEPANKRISSIVHTAVLERSQRAPGDRKIQEMQSIQRMMEGGRTEVVLNGEYGSEWHDEDLKVFDGTSAVQQLELSNNPGISDAGLGYLSGLPLRKLLLDGTNVRTLAQMPPCEKTLSWLSLSRTEVTDKALESLNRFENIVKLDLEDTNVSYDAIRKLARNLPFNEIRLRGCRNITSNQRNALHKEFPMCAVYPDHPDCQMEIDAGKTTELLVSGKAKEALVIWRNWEKFALKNADPRKRLLMTSLAKQGLCLDELKKYDQANRCFEQAKKICDKSGTDKARMTFVDALFKHFQQTKRLDEAIAMGRESVELHSRLESSVGVVTSDRQSDLAQVLMDKGKWAEAAQILKKALLVKKQNVANFQMRMARMNGVPEPVAGPDYLRSLEFDVAVNLTKLAVCQAQSNRRQESKPNFNEAISIFERVQGSKPEYNYAFAYYSLANVEILDHNFERAMELNDKALKLYRVLNPNPNEPLMAALAERKQIFDFSGRKADAAKVEAEMVSLNKAARRK